ncbi:hypothetical protein ACFFRR_001839, partial [Megaselia abdita]
MSRFIVKFIFINQNVSLQMEAWNRKRTRPTIVTNRDLRRCVPRAPSPPPKRYCPDEEPVFDEFQPNFNDWAEMVEMEIERIIQQRMNPPSIPVFDPQQTVFLKTSGEAQGIEVLQRDSDEEIEIDVEPDDDTPSVISLSSDSTAETLRGYDPEFPTYDSQRLSPPISPIDFEQHQLPETPPPSASHNTQQFSFPIVMDEPLRETDDVTDEELSIDVEIMKEEATDIVEISDDEDVGECISVSDENESLEEPKTSVASIYEPSVFREDPTFNAMPSFHCDIPATGPGSILWWVRDVCPRDPNYEPIHVVNEETNQQKKKVTLIPTQWLPYGSLYWKQCLDRINQHPGEHQLVMRNSLDNARIGLKKFKDGRIRATRNFVSVIIQKKSDAPKTLNWEAAYWKGVKSQFRGRQHYTPSVSPEEDPQFRASTRIVEEFPDKVRIGKIPTDAIPWNSPYYAELLETIYFPREKHHWYHSRGRDGVPVHFRLGEQGRSLFAYRNG